MYDDEAEKLVDAGEPRALRRWCRNKNLAPRNQRHRASGAIEEQLSCKVGAGGLARVCEGWTLTFELTWNRLHSSNLTERRPMWPAHTCLGR